ncbi:MAG: phosphoribosylanthranilate isomerase [Rhodospirillaceae bacterium]|nr:phosphoribosylanthranilate isomerase [Rhodospirillaceae bacterium]
MKLQVKICGVSTPEAMDAAVDGGARFVGLVFYPRSPRAVSPNLAAQLARVVPTGVRVVGLFVDPDDDRLDEVIGQVPLDLIQLHGHETPARVAAIRSGFNIPAMKAISVAAAEDLDGAAAYDGVADRLLFDAKPPANVTALPGGNGIPFDWALVAGRRWGVPWMLSGGLNADNLAEAVRQAGAAAVDVSSGVEDRPGHKSPELIRRFLEAAAAV